ncbi:glutathione S-transferase family protein [Novosphingobium sp. BW1]|uniref:glutathione S-transferase family protein n=1 Tax=Novosphingobium sp. BW1 TaxID=2592621 RepID=UPI0011DEA70E|nr:glutathione S-transferase N-terminal domain-containing protein [Novosphingobium sp. BW1]TYC84938.1 glutathione S-transferase [Novosphingobium sp. BW1]
MLELWTSETPNGWKTTIMLEELDANYTLRPISLTNREQKEDWYLARNPNGRIPTLIDHEVDAENGGFAVFESGAILIYLAEKFGRFLPADTMGRSRAIQWVMWQMSGLGPMMGQATVFNRYFEPKLPDVIDRYTRESRRLFEVMDIHLADNEFLAGDYSIADIACFPWVRGHDWACIDMEGLPHLRRWFENIGERPAVKRGLLLPEPPKAEEMADKTTRQGKNILA